MNKIPLLKDISLYPEGDTKFSEKIIKLQKEIRKAREKIDLSEEQLGLIFID